MGIDFRRPKYVTGFRWGEALIWTANGGSGGGGIPTLISGIPPLTLSDALAKALESLVQYGKVEQNETPTPAAPVNIACNNGTLIWKDRELPVGYTRIERITFGGNTYYETNEKLYGSDVVTMTISDFVSSGQNLFGCYSGTSDDVYNFSLYVYGTSTGQAYWRYGKTLYRPTVGGTTQRTITFGAGGTNGFKTDVSYDEVEFETTDTARIGALPNSSSPKFNGDIIGNVTVGNRLRYIPCIRESDGAIGYYELMNRCFLEPQGSAPVAGAADITHMALEVVGTPEEISLSASGATTQTASAVSLFGTDDYQDTQDIITGEVVRNAGIEVFDGTEDWKASDGNAGLYYINFAEKKIEKTALVCTHFEYTTVASAQTTHGQFMCGAASRNTYFRNTDCDTVEDWKAWLAAQYAASTPVIMIYPLAESTTEAATPQSLSTVEGDNTLTVTAEVDDISLDVTYVKHK